MSKFDSVVVERRLRPIYDSFEVGNNKKALHETEKVLKKTPNLRCARALKGLALMRLGKTEESNAIINQIVAEKPSDEATMQVLSYIYKEMEEFAKICVIYQNAVEKDGTNEELLTQLFMSYARIDEFAMQQRVAMELYKFTQKKPYFCWIVMSCLLKAFRGTDKDDPTKRKVSLELAQRMMEKMINESKLNAEQDAQLYLIILNEQKKYAEQLTFLDSTTCKSIYAGAPIEMRIKLMKNLKQWPELNVLLKGLLKEHIDRWDLYQDYIQTVVELVKNKTAPETDDKTSYDTSFESCHEFLCELIESSNKKFRGPYLARLELYRVMDRNQFDAHKLLGEFIELLIDYFRIFGEKPCCAKDIVLFLDDLKEQQKPELASKLIQLCNISATTLPQTKEQMQRHICSLQVSRQCGAHALSADHLTALYTAFTLHYEHGLNAFGIDMLPTDMGLSDAYALLAVHVMYDLALQLKTSDHLVEALCLLNYLLSNSPSNFHAKLLCLQLYHRIGCYWGAQKMYESLNLKFIQLDSMGYLHCSRLATSGMHVMSRSVYEPTLKFFTNSYKEGHEYVSMCYKYGSFSKLQEFMDFHESLAFSYHYSLTSSDAIISEIVCLGGANSTPEQNMNAFKYMQIDSDRDNIQYTKLRDNRDLSVIVRWDPNQEETQKRINAQSFQQDLDLLRIRGNMIRLIAICIETATKETYGKHSKNDENSVAKNKCDLLEIQLNNWTELFKEIRSANHSVTSNEYLVNLLPSRLHGQLDMPYESIFHSLAKLILSLELRCVEPIEDIFNAFDRQLIDACKTICSTIEAYNADDDRLWNRRNVQETIAHGIEIFALATFVMSVVHEKYLANTNRQAKRSKKKSTTDETAGKNIYTPNDKERVNIITSLINRLKTELNTIDAAMESWKAPRLPKTLTETLASLSLNPKVETLVDSTITKNHEITIDEIRTILKDKLRCLNSLSKVNV
ncbi:phagocyte signaling-impaired protein [Contarinia nasturtii]|uniref:phagocyte signaling-impaired protein n=1 Tax=Contarinia nasturtii TaxID=265458 RepID=UPI0012D4384D|nr:phagocyte signaling-impaired protein [Contarinia nasturtii]